jgi:hypothetical protein
MSVIVLMANANRQLLRGDKEVIELTMIFDRKIIEAEIALGLIASADMPRVAWDALEAGLDGPGIRRLAALEKPTFFEVRDVFDRAATEMGISSITLGEAAKRIAKRRISEILTNGENPLRHLKFFESLWTKAEYPRELRDIGTLYDHVYIAEITGQSKDEIKKWVLERLKTINDLN